MDTVDTGVGRPAVVSSSTLFVTTFVAMAMAVAFVSVVVTGADLVIGDDDDCPFPPTTPLAHALANSPYASSSAASEISRNPGLTRPVQLYHTSPSSVDDDGDDDDDDDDDVLYALRIVYIPLRIFFSPLRMRKKMCLCVCVCVIITIKV